VVLRSVVYDSLVDSGLSTTERPSECFVGGASPQIGELSLRRTSAGAGFVLPARSGGLVVAAVRDAAWPPYYFDYLSNCSKPLAACAIDRSWPARQ
jgi:hypothetical protein